MFTASDVIILGAGMAGASLAAELAPHRKVVMVEIEDQPGRHATGRSAAMFFESLRAFVCFFYSLCAHNMCAHAIADAAAELGCTFIHLGHLFAS